MPVFTFEKITPPESPTPDPAPKPRGVIVQLLDRFLEARVKRTAVEEQAVIPREPKSPE